MQEDKRKEGLKNGIRQLTNDQIFTTLLYADQMAYDHGNYVDGKFCPLAVGAGVDRLDWSKNPPTNDKVAAMLTLMGYTVNNTRGIMGEFYKDNRKEDYKTAALEVLAERGVDYCE